MNLERWPIFSLLDDDFTGKIKMVRYQNVFQQVVKIKVCYARDKGPIVVILIM